MAQDPYARIRCPVCGVPWRAHQPEIYIFPGSLGTFQRLSAAKVVNICARYGLLKPALEPEELKAAEKVVEANTPAEERQGS